MGCNVEVEIIDVGGDAATIVADSGTGVAKSDFVKNEILSGTVNGSNATFTTQFDFFPGSTEVFINHVPLVLVQDYQEIPPRTIHFVESPQTTEEPRINYIKN